MSGSGLVHPAPVDNTACRCGRRGGSGLFLWTKRGACRDVVTLCRREHASDTPGPAVSRPTLLPGLRRLWRDRHAVQLGTDPRRAVVLEFADPRLARVLDLLDGSRTEQAVLRDAATLGITEPAAVALLSTLRDGGLAVDAH